MPAIKFAPFVKHVLQSQLLEAAQREELLRLQATIADPRELARELLRREWLTAYQVNQLLQGKTENLAVGPYVLLERIGEGGMGQVFKAKQKVLNRIVALKVIRKECMSNPRAILRFQREIRTTGSLSHPHIVRAFDADHVDGTYYIAMEYIEGVDLARLVRDNGPLRVDQACEYLRQAALGLQHAYERGLVHRDIKPANLLVTRAVAADRRRSSGYIRLPANIEEHKKSPPANEDASYPWGIVKILDMGLARCTDAFGNRASTHLTAIGAIMGTPEYISPEQARDSHASDVRSDLYSLGCTFYFLMTGVPPFSEGTMTEKLLQHQTDEPRPVHIVRRDRLLARQGANEPASVDKAMLHVPIRVQDVLRKLMAKQPENRFQTPLELANELQIILHKYADGSLFMDEGEVELANTPAPGPFTFSLNRDAAENHTVVISSSIPSTHIEQPRPRTFPKVAVILTAGGLFAFLGVITVLAGLMARANFTQASVVRDAPHVRSKEVEEPHWKRLLKHAVQHNGPWEETRQELRNQRAAATDPDQAKMYDDLLAKLPTALDLLERSKFDGAMPPGLPADVIGVYGYSKANAVKAVTSLAVSPIGRWIAANEDNGVRLFDVQGSLIPHKIFAHSQRLTCLAFSPDGRVLATAGDDGLVRLWDVNTRTRLFSLDKHKRPVTQLAFNHDATLLASVGRNGAIRVWDPRSGAEVRKLDGAAAEAGTLAFAADGKTLFWTNALGAVSWWDGKAATPTGKADTKITGLRSLALQPHGNLVAISGGQGGSLAVFTWDGVDLTEKSKLTGHQQIQQVAFASDGKTFLSAGSESSAILWDANTLKPIKSWNYTRSAVLSAAFSVDNRHVVLGTANGQTHIVRLAQFNVEAIRASLQR